MMELLQFNALAYKVKGAAMRKHPAPDQRLHKGIAPMTKELPSIELLHKLLRCDPEKGKLFWRERDDVKANVRSRLTGQEALCNIQNNGYARGAINGRFVLAHRVIWAMVHGEWPDEIDHINGDRADNRIENLRSVNKSQNARNLSLQGRNVSGYMGVTWYKPTQQWAAAICVNYKKIHLGYYSDVHEAGNARKKAEAKYGFHKNHGAR